MKPLPNHNEEGDDAVALEIKLLGEPSVSMGGRAVRRPRGRKAWALLAFLLLGKRNASRSELSDLLFGEADDPVRALRWNLTELRHLLGPNSIGRTDPVEVVLPPGASVDVLNITSGRWSTSSNFDGLGRDLLEGMHFSDSVAFEAWLTNERRYLKSCAADVLRELAVASLALGKTEAAISDAVSLVALDPLDESAQALLIRCYAVAGDAEAATRQLVACRTLLRDELGVEPSEAVLAAVHASPSTLVRTPSGGTRSIKAQIEAGRAAARAGATDSGVECFRRAAAEAHSLGDLELSLESLLALGSTLAHAGVDRHQEASAALHSAINTARRLGRSSECADAQMELAWMEFLRARYERAISWIDAAVADAPDDKGILCMALWVRGKCAMEIGSYGESVKLLGEAVTLVEQMDNPMRRCYCLASYGRTWLLMEEFGRARPLLEESLEIALAQGFTWFTPVPETFLGELETATGNLERAEELLENARARAQAVEDASLESQAVRAIGMLHAARGDTDAAIETLIEARAQLIAFPDWEWTLAHTLDCLAKVTAAAGDGTARSWVDELEVIAGRAAMKELVVHAYVYRGWLGDDEAWRIAHALASDVDNPALGRILGKRPAAAKPR